MRSNIELIEKFKKNISEINFLIIAGLIWVDPQNIFLNQVKKMN